MNCKTLTLKLLGDLSVFSVAGLLVLFVVFAMLSVLTTQSLVMLVSTLCVGLLALVVCLVNKPASGTKKQSEPASEENMVSIVALFDELPYVDEAILSAHVNRAWGMRIENNQDDESFVAGWAPLFIIKTPHQIYAVNYLDKNYFDNLDEVLDEVTELRLANVIRSHNAWISVDLVSDSQGLDTAYHYAMIGRLLNQMINQDCVGLLVPDQMKLMPWDESVEQALTSNDPLENLCPSQPPVIPISDNNPDLVAAVRMARDRFPHFVTEFENHQRNEDRDPSRQFVVKAPVTVAGRTEFIWITTTAIENGILYGTLDNQPVSLPGLCRGDRIRVAISQINDWIYTRDDKMFGGFTSRVINQWARSQHAQS